MPTIESTIEFIKKAHEGQVDKAGQPYYLHPIRVMRRLPDTTSEDAKLAALLHDILEDTPYVKGDLYRFGYSQYTIDIVELLTNKPGETYLDKIKVIINSGNRGAILVKCADIRDNLDPARLRKLPREDRERLVRKYVPAFELLSETVFSKIYQPHNGFELMGLWR